MTINKARTVILAFIDFASFENITGSQLSQKFSLLMLEEKKYET